MSLAFAAMIPEERYGYFAAAFTILVFHAVV